MPAALPSGMTAADRNRLYEIRKANLEVMQYRYKARPQQLPPWNPLAPGWAGEHWHNPKTGLWQPYRTEYTPGGRGSGKTQKGAWNAAETAVRLGGLLPDGQRVEGAIVAHTANAARQACVEGPSGILRALGGVGGPHVIAWNRSEPAIYLRNGGIIHVTTAENGARAIQSKNLSWVWGDEIGLWPLNKWREAWVEAIMFAVRKGPMLRILTGTPKEGHPLVQMLINDPAVKVTRMSLRDNAANLPAEFIQQQYDAHEGTRLGAQELEGEILTDVPGALWTSAEIDTNRLTDAEIAGREWRHVVIAWDPANTSGNDSDEHGIIVLALDHERPGHVYILDDLSGRYGPDEAARRVGAGYDRYSADAIVYEKNGAEDWIIRLVEQVIPDKAYAMQPVASHKSKARRAEPIVAMTQQGRVHYCGEPAKTAKLADQCTKWTEGSGFSPDRMDAKVHGATWLAERSLGSSITILGVTGA